VENSKQVSENLEDLRTSWYSISKLCQGLKRYKSQKDEGFVGSIDSIISAVEGFEKLIEDVYKSITTAFPSHPKKLEREKDEILQEVAGFKSVLREDQGTITKVKEIDKGQVKEKLKKLQQQYEDLERLSSERCNKYFERKREYTIAREKIEEEVGKRVTTIREAFVDRVADVVEGYDIVLEGRSTFTEELFDALIEDRAKTDSIQIRTLERGGLLGKISGSVQKHESAKESVLKYEAHEIIQRALPLKKKEAELIEKLDHKFIDLKGLEEDCRRAEEKREKVVDTRNNMRMELEGLDTKANPKDIYLKNFDEITPKVESFISLSKVIGDARPAPKEMEEEIIFEIDSSDEELDSLTKDVKETKSKDELLEYKKKVEELKSHLKYLEAEIEKRLNELE
jgi:hypothetical protein